MNKEAEHKYEDLPYRFTRDELYQLGLELARVNQKVYQLRADLKVSSAVMGGAIKEGEAEAAALAQKINEGREPRPTEVAWLLDTPRPGVKTLQRLDTFEEVRVEGMTDAERQGSLAFGDEPDIAGDKSRHQ